MPTVTVTSTGALKTRRGRSTNQSSSLPLISGVVFSFDSFLCEEGPKRWATSDYSCFDMRINSHGWPPSICRVV